MTYREGLQRQEWGNKRLEILERDNFKCQKCGKERPQLRNLNKDFGQISQAELHQRGYSVDFNYVETKSPYETILCFSPSNYLSLVKFIGDQSRPFKPDELIFAARFLPGEVELLCFYIETFLGQDLTDLNIHHNYYIKGHKPWEYDNGALIALCVDCHRQTHEEETIPVYSEIREKLFDSTNCDKCGGSGYLREFNHYKNGVCFKCHGEGVVIDY